MDNYIGKIEAEWVDPAVELPPENGYYYARSRDGSCWPAYFSRTDDGRGLWGVPVFAWLRIGGPSDTVPRAKVQAAVNEIKRIRTQTVYGYQATGLDIALDELRDHTGVTPTEVK